MATTDWRGRRPVTQDDYDQVRQLHAEHLPRNEIARRLDRSPHTISRIAKELGLSWDRANAPGLQMATQARQADGRARRTALALALLDDAEKLRAQLFAPTVAYNFGGKDNTYNEHALTEPGFRDKRDLMHAIGIAIDRAVRLDEYDSGASLTGVVSLLDTLGKGLRERYGDGADEHPTDLAD